MIKLTGVNNKALYINVFNLISFCEVTNDGNETIITCIDDQVYFVKETPEQILQLTKELK